MTAQKERIVPTQPDEHKHNWDKLTGIWQQGIPHIGIKGKWVRTCINCGYKEYYSKGMFTGWFSVP